MIPSTVPSDGPWSHPSAVSAAGDERWAAYPVPVRRTLFGLRRLSPEWRDALLYGCSALFAGVTALAVGIPLYRQWGQMAVGPYLVAAGVTALAG